MTVDFSIFKSVHSIKYLFNKSARMQLRHSSSMMLQKAYFWMPRVLERALVKITTGTMLYLRFFVPLKEIGTRLGGVLFFVCFSEVDLDGASLFSWGM